MNKILKILAVILLCQSCSYEPILINKLYDFLRMLDAPSYPNAFIELKNFRFIFNDIKKMNNSINARVKIVKNEK